MSKFVDFKAVKAAVSILQVLERYGIAETFKHSGDSLSGRCPLHDGQNPTQFRVSIGKNCWHCFGRCNDGGNVLDFVARKENISLRKAALLLCEWFDPPTEEKPSGKVDRKPSDQKETRFSKAMESGSDRGNGERDDAPNKPLGFSLQNLETDHPYFAERGLGMECINYFGLGYCSNGTMSGHIAIPIHNAEGRLVAYAGRWPGNPSDDETPKYRLPPGFRKARELFNLHRAVQESCNQPLVIVEGFFDCFALWQRGIRRVIALMGSSLSDAQESLIIQITNPQSRIVLMLDEDETGREARMKIIPRLARHCFVHDFRFDHEGQEPDSLTVEQCAEFQ